jgi:short-subunit dehydrogenase
MMQDTSSIIVTASSHGLGHAIAKIFSQKYNVILHGRKSEIVKKAASEIENVVEFVIGDIREEETLKKIYDAALKYNSSILINNAAIPCYGVKLETMTEKQIIESLSTNLIAPILLSHKLYPVLKKACNGGIININSIVGIEPKKNRSVHSATKWGLRGFSKSLKLEAELDNVKVMNVYPTRIMTTDDFIYGLIPKEVATKIYDNYHEKEMTCDLVIDGRPVKYRPEKKYEA